MPPKFVTFEGNEVRQNPYQKWTWKAWLDCWKWAKTVIGKDPWGAVIAGDAIDGAHHMASGNREMWSVNEDDHLTSAVDVLDGVLRGASEVYLSEGTHAHTGYSEHAMAQVLASRGIPVISPKGKGAWPELDIRINGCLTCVDHHVSTTSLSYRESGAFSGTMGDVTARRARAGLDVPKFIVRAHRHQFGMFDDGYCTMVILPAWQGATRFTHRVVPRIVPQVGLVIADWRSVPYGEQPVIHKRLHTIV